MHLSASCFDLLGNHKDAAVICPQKPLEFDRWQNQEAVQDGSRDIYEDKLHRKNGAQLRTLTQDWVSQQQSWFEE